MQILQQSSGAVCQKIQQSLLPNKHLQLCRQSCLWLVVQKERGGWMCKHSSEEIAFRKALQAQEKQDIFINHFIYFSHVLLESWLIAAVLGESWSRKQATANTPSSSALFMRDLHEKLCILEHPVWASLNSLHGHGCSTLRQRK